MKIGIVGGGFSGTMLAVQLIRHSNKRIEIVVVNETENFALGVAYNPYSSNHLLNVVAGKMSAFPDQADHFVNWLITQPEFKSQDLEILKKTFVPRKVYGHYLTDLWVEYKKIAKNKGIVVSEVVGRVTKLNMNQNKPSILLENNQILHFDKCVIATGNQLPGNPIVQNSSFFESSKYFQNPWKIESVQGLKKTDVVLIVGNGLTMVDTVLGLLQQGYQGKIYSLSRHGYGIIPHRESKFAFTIDRETKLTEMSLLELVHFVNSNRKKLDLEGSSPEVIVDAFRPYTQEIWKGLSLKERKLFMSRLRHLWGVLRHRVPLQVQTIIQQLVVEEKLEILSGKILDFTENPNSICVKYGNNKTHTIESLEVTRIINCTGPESDLRKLEDHFLHHAYNERILFQDELKLGICTDLETFRVKKINGGTHNNLYTIGTNLKGELWESTAVNELRIQVDNLAKQVLK